VGPHRFTRTLGITVLDGLEDALVMVLPTLRATLYMESAQPLFAQNSHDRIDQR
jgi:hypothetical protein